MSDPKELKNKAENTAEESVDANKADGSPSEEQLTLAQAQQTVDAYIQTFGVRYFSELTNMAILTEEVGEVARLISRKYGDQSFKKSDTGKELGDELADVLWVVICLANQTDVDLTAAFHKNMAKKISRDAVRHLNNEKLKD